MKKIFIVVDAQNDFITGALANSDADKKVNDIVNELSNFDKKYIYFTADTHYTESYDNSLEGQKLPVAHCLFSTNGWCIDPRLFPYVTANNLVIKNTFGYTKWNLELNTITSDDEIHICGFCTDICVVSNALILRALYPNTKIYCHEDLCSGTSLDAHNSAIDVMRSCQIDIVKKVND